jgi:hypothetical protein
MKHAWAGLLVFSLTASAASGELLAVAQQNSLVEKYCAVCHTDAAPKGGLSLEHFDAAKVPPSVAAMMVSKLTGGVSLQTAREASSNPSAAALIDRKMNSGGMGVAGIPIPDKATIDALIGALTVESQGATEWSVEQSAQAAYAGPVVTASILQEALSGPGEAEFYRLEATCKPATREGQMQLVWAPVPRSGRIAASVDGGAVVRYRVDGSENMANAAAMLTGAPFPAESLRVSDLFPGQTVTFSFASLPKDARAQLTACFPSAAPSR